MSDQLDELTKAAEDVSETIRESMRRARQLIEDAKLALDDHEEPQLQMSDRQDNPDRAAHERGPKAATIALASGSP